MILPSSCRTRIHHVYLTELTYPWMLFFNWVCANKLSLNATKTQYMAIQPPTKTFDLSTYTLIIDNVILTQTTSCKFLGMTIDESLSWNKHILNINSKLSRALFVINKSNCICQKTVCIHCTIHYLFLISLIRDSCLGQCKS